MLGLAHTTVIFLMNLVSRWSGKTTAPNPSLDIGTIQDFRHLLARAILYVTSEFFVTMCLLLLLVLLVTIFKRQWLAIAALWTLEYLLLGLFFASGGHWTAWLGTAIICVITVTCLTRFGLLATLSFFTFFHLSFHNAISPDVSRWYFGSTIFSAAAIFGMAIYGFYTSLAGQKIFEANFLKDIES
jgi:hypothetical protein